MATGPITVTVNSVATPPSSSGGGESNDDDQKMIILMLVAALAVGVAMCCCCVALYFYKVRGRGKSPNINGTTVAVGHPVYDEDVEAAAPGIPVSGESNAKD